MTLQLIEIARTSRSAGCFFKLWVTIALVMGTVALLIGLGFGGRSLRDVIGSQRAVGTVIALESKPGSDTQAPVVEYHVASQRYEVKGVVSVSHRWYAKGKSVPVYYNPGQPADARIATFAELWLLPLVFSGIGTIFVVAGVVLLKLSNRNRAENSGQ